MAAARSLLGIFCFRRKLKPTNAGDNKEHSLGFSGATPVMIHFLMPSLKRSLPIGHTQVERSGTRGTCHSLCSSLLRGDSGTCCPPPINRTPHEDSFIRHGNLFIIVSATKLWAVLYNKRKPQLLFVHGSHNLQNRTGIQKGGNTYSTIGSATFC